MRFAKFFMPDRLGHGYTKEGCNPSSDVRFTEQFALKKADSHHNNATEPHKKLSTHAKDFPYVNTSRDHGSRKNVAPVWRRFVDAEQRIEMEIPSHWVVESSRDYLLDLHAPDDPWTAILLSFHSLDLLRFHERVNELVSKDRKRWSLQRKVSLLHNGHQAIEADFVLLANGSGWLMRKTYLMHGNGLFALAFMTRHATWPRYGAIHHHMLHSLSSFSDESRPRMQALARSDPAPSQLCSARIAPL